ncbi:uncharacterized protein LOC130623229 [Hydractinia symbiolongicarpus]|uniref:uncharacterized protein LOC130623229 n=1 Tax=Hydractinia symbiolongicarpus TaxID=13093 RepID=UPI00254F080A|nr:uncharacterized protein LOC130623229 [Hydractinia symbiolongicarpus]
MTSGLGTFAKSLTKTPIKTVKAFGAFGKSYLEIRKANLKDGNLAAHEKANYDATKIAGSIVSSAISAAREAYKRFRIKTNPDGSKHYGDTRTPKEIKDTMDANKRGREKALGEKLDVVKKGPLFSIRPRDSTGHRTGLATLAKSLVKNPTKTVKAIAAFGKSYLEMKKANLKGGNLGPHEKANYNATKIAGLKVSSAISAAREAYKRFRIKTNPDGSKHYGDTRTQKEIKDTMDANQRGREKALGEKLDVVKKGPLFSIRPHDSTGHRTGLATLAKSLVKNPTKTVKAIAAFGKSYPEMKKANLKGGNLGPHEKANYNATKIAGLKVSSAISAAREAYKRFRIKTNPDGSKHYGDTRTPKEIKDTMDANKRGREKALGEKLDVVKKGPLFSIRPRDSTGHRTGLATLAKSLVKNPTKTVKAIAAFGKSYLEMKKANLKGGNLGPHEKANYNATKIAGLKVSSAISAAREAYKRFRIKTNPDGSKHYGDTRTQKEIKDTMDANQRGREKARG